MKPKWVATLYAKKNKALHGYEKLTCNLFLMSLFLLIISCESNDLETMINESPAPNELPTDTESPTNDLSLIVFTDIVPDFTSENLNESYNLDLNNDQIIDFILSSESYEGWDWLGISSGSNAANKIISIAPWYTHPLPLNGGQEIFNLREYRNGEFYEAGGIFSVGDCFGGDPDCSYSWQNKVDRFLGLKFIINGQTHYGWACLEVISPTNWIIKDYAFNSIPNKPIFAGQKK